MLLGERLPTREAAQAGLIRRCVADHRLDGEVLGVATQLAAAPWMAVTATKRRLRQAFANELGVQIQHEVEAQRLCIRSADAAEARRAFVEKRKPSFAARPTY